jgi:hypothetical protein
MKTIPSILTIVTVALSLAAFQHCSSSKSDPAPVEVPKLNQDVINLFNNVYTAPTGFQEASMTNPTADGKQVWVIKDIKGDKDLIWAGGRTVQSPMWPSPLPLYYPDEVGGYIFLPNLNASNWLSKQFSAAAQPYDIYIVLRDVEAQQDEGYFAVSFGVRNIGDHLKYVLNSPGNNPEVDMDRPFVPEFNKRSILRLRIDGPRSRLWINNVPVTYKGSNTVDLGSAPITFLGYGSNSHVAQHDFYSMLVKFGTLSDAENKTVYDELAKYYNIGTYPEKPFASKIKAVGNNANQPRVWTATYEYVSTTGTLEDTGKTEYQWGYFDVFNGSKNDINEANILAGATSKTLARNDYPSLFKDPGKSKAFVFVIVKVYDTKGDSWSHFVRSPLTVDNY